MVGGDGAGKTTLIRMLLGLLPVSSASPADLVAAVGPAIQRYLTGDLNSR